MELKLIKEYFIGKGILTFLISHLNLFADLISHRNLHSFKIENFPDEFQNEINTVKKLFDQNKKKIEELVPSNSYYEHDDWDIRTENMQEDENVNGRSHVRGTIIGSTGVTLPIINSELIIGRWQRLFFVELDCARSRRLFVQTQDLN